MTPLAFGDILLNGADLGYRRYKGTRIYLYNTHIIRLLSLEIQLIYEYTTCIPRHRKNASASAHACAPVCVCTFSSKGQFASFVADG